MQLDDDYTGFYFMIDTGSAENRGDRGLIKNIDNVFDIFLTFYKSRDFHAICFAQHGDFIGGINNGIRSYRFSRRKAMNSFLCSIERPFKFVGAMNEDVNTYTTLGSRGEMFFTIPFCSLNQLQTQSQSGGITDMYLKYGTYCKSFTTVMMMPSSVKVSMMRSANARLHHKINWSNTVPQIISEDLRKTRIKQGEES